MYVDAVSASAKTACAANDAPDDPERITTMARAVDGPRIPRGPAAQQQRLQEQTQAACKSPHSLACRQLVDSGEGGSHADSAHDDKGSDDHPGRGTTPAFSITDTDSTDSPSVASSQQQPREAAPNNTPPATAAQEPTSALISKDTSNHTTRDARLASQPSQFLLVQHVRGNLRKRSPGLFSPILRKKRSGQWAAAPPATSAEHSGLECHSTDADTTGSLTDQRARPTPPLSSSAPAGAAGLDGPAVAETSVPSALDSTADRTSGGAPAFVGPLLDSSTYTSTASQSAGAGRDGGSGKVADAHGYVGRS